MAWRSMRTERFSSPGRRVGTFPESPWRGAGIHYPFVAKLTTNGDQVGCVSSMVAAQGRSGSRS